MKIAKRLRLIAVILLFCILPMACNSERPVDVIMGKWQGDPDNARNDPAIVKEAEGNPMGDFFLKAMEEFYKSLKVEITRTNISIDTQFPGEEPQKDSVVYKVISIGTGSVTIASKESGSRGGTFVITIVDHDHIRIDKAEAKGDEPAYILKRRE